MLLWEDCLLLLLLIRRIDSVHAARSAVQESRVSRLGSVLDQGPDRGSDTLTGSSAARVVDRRTAAIIIVIIVVIVIGMAVVAAADSIHEQAIIVVVEFEAGLRFQGTIGQWQRWRQWCKAADVLLFSRFLGLQSETGKNV